MIMWSIPLPVTMISSKIVLYHFFSKALKQIPQSLTKPPNSRLNKVHPQHETQNYIAESLNYMHSYPT